MISFFNFSENLNFQKFKNVDIPILVVGFCEGTLSFSDWQLLRQNATAQMLLVSKM